MGVWKKIVAQSDLNEIKKDTIIIKLSEGEEPLFPFPTDIKKYKSLYIVVGLKVDMIEAKSIDAVSNPHLVSGMNQNIGGKKIKLESLVSDNWWYLVPSEKQQP